MIQEKIHEVEHHFKATFKHIEEIAKRHNVSIAFLKDLETSKQYFNPQCANRNKSRLLFSSAEMYKNSVDPDQTAPIGAVCSGSKLFASLLNSSVMLGNYLKQTTSADDIFLAL